LEIPRRASKKSQDSRRHNKISEPAVYPQNFSCTFLTGLKLRGFSVLEPCFHRILEGHEGASTDNTHTCVCLSIHAVMLWLTTGLCFGKYIIRGLWEHHRVFTQTDSAVTSGHVLWWACSLCLIEVALYSV
jgi:peptidoglycan biosynthesis protein MviN/MurJ (putative lipid II flippase)